LGADPVQKLFTARRCPLIVLVIPTTEAIRVAEAAQGRNAEPHEGVEQVVEDGGGERDGLAELPAGSAPRDGGPAWRSLEATERPATRRLRLRVGGRVRPAQNGRAVTRNRRRSARGPGVDRYAIGG